jgi:hypothetical protein
LVLRTRGIFLKCVGVIGLIGPTLAADSPTIDKYYQAQTIITGVLEPERMRGFREGLEEILIKVTNAPELADDGRLKPLIEHAADLIADYSLEDRNKHLKINDEQGTRDRPHYLRMKADRAKVDEAIARLGLKPWFDRPIFEVLLVVHDPRGAFLVGDELPPDQASREVAKIRLGGEDLNLVSKTWDGFEQREALKSIGKRRGYDVAFPNRPDAKPDGSVVNPVFPPSEAGRAIARWRGDLFPDASGFWRLESRAWKVSGAGEVDDDPTCYGSSRGGVTFDISIRDSLDAFARAFKDGMTQKCHTGPT